MSSFHFDVGEKRRSTRLAGRIRRALLRALGEERDENGLTQQKLADKLGVHRSVINRQLTGEANLTLKSLSELLWGMNRELRFDIVRLNADETANASSTYSIQPMDPTSVKHPVSPSSSKSREIVLTDTRGEQAKRVVFEVAA